MTVLCKACPFSECNCSCIWSLSRALTHQQSSQRSAASMLCARTDTQTQTNTPADRSSAGQHPSGRVLLSPAGSWQMPRLLPVITPDLSQHASLSLCSPTLRFLVSSLPLSHLSLFPCDSGPRRPPLLFPSLFSPATPCRLPLPYTRMNSLPSRFQVASLSTAG